MTHSTLFSLPNSMSDYQIVDQLSVFCQMEVEVYLR